MRILTSHSETDSIVILKKNLIKLKENQNYNFFQNIEFLD